MGTDLSTIIPWILAHAGPVGAVLLLAGVLVAAFGRALGRVVLLAGLLVTAALAFQEWRATQDLVLAAGLLVAGLIASGLLATAVRFLSVLLELALFAGGWYLLVYAIVGPAYLATNLGLATWGIGAVLSALAIEAAGRRRRLLRAAGAAAMGASAI